MLVITLFFINDMFGLVKQFQVGSGELAPYFALDQTITVRYAEEKSTSPNRLDVALPWITVIGEES